MPKLRKSKEAEFARHRKIMAERLFLLRQERNMAQQELAEALGVSTTTLANWERGKSLPSYDNLRKLYTYFDVSLDWIMGHTDER